MQRLQVLRLDGPIIIGFMSMRAIKNSVVVGRLTS